MYPMVLAFHVNEMHLAYLFFASFYLFEHDKHIFVHRLLAEKYNIEIPRSQVTLFTSTLNQYYNFNRAPNISLVCQLPYAIKSSILHPYSVWWLMS